MHLVVEISEDTFFDLKKKQNRTEVDNVVLNGTPLPKGHDRLVEAHAVVKALFDYKTIDDVPTIIEADKEVDNKSDN